MLRSLRHRVALAYNQLVVHPESTIFAFRAGVCGGLAAVAIDLDHLTLFFGHPDGRVAHAPLLILAIVVGSYCLARIGGLVLGVVLKRDRRRRSRCTNPQCLCGGLDEKPK